MLQIMEGGGENTAGQRDLIQITVVYEKENGKHGSCCMFLLCLLIKF